MSSFFSLRKHGVARVVMFGVRYRQVFTHYNEIRQFCRWKAVYCFNVEGRHRTVPCLYQPVGLSQTWPS